MLNTLKNIAVAAVLLGLAVPASANYNSRYGTHTWSDLPTKAVVSKNIWVGSWWAYKTNGIAHRQNATGDMKICTHNGGCTNNAGWVNTETAKHLSPAEKYDTMVGRADKIQREELSTFLDKIREKETEVDSKIKRRAVLIRLLNAWIEENPNENWRETDDGKEYLEIVEAIEAAETELSENIVELDTATEWEIYNHGKGQFGVQSWFGHCNAWAAAAIVEPEPRQTTTVDGIEWTAGDVKGLITEAYMEINSSFWGSRNNYHEDEKSREAVDFKDLTPAQFHILFADQLGNKDTSFVIDRYTGDQVWNQPVKGFKAEIEVLNEGEATRKTIQVTEYPWSGKPNEKDLGEVEVWELAVTTDIYWVTDGLPHETLTILNIGEELLENGDSAYAGQLEHRQLSYVLWLDKAPTDADAKIIGDGAWNHGSSTAYTQLHPDFAWQPTGNVNTARDYENEFLDWATIETKIIPGSLAAAEDPTVEPSGNHRIEGEFAIPDKDKETGVSVELKVQGANISEIAEMEVAIKVRHTYIGDLKVSLVGPDGRSANLKQFGSGGSDDNIDRTYDVKKFKGIPADGTWTLRVWDQWRDDEGVVESLEINFK
ncbi:MAG: hypothetical protein ACI9WU_002096 [Myxococcota bacterium]|jgi:hypothetical protein